MKPVPSVNAGTPYGARGSWWSCNRNSAGNGIHTGVDYPGASGAKVVAARPGTVRYVNFGSAFGSHQLAVDAGDGTCDFYAHMQGRAVPNGKKVDAGEKVGSVGAEGNVSGPHLHFERHNRPASAGWYCGVCVDPKPSINWQPKEDDMPLNDDDLSAIAARVNHTLGDYDSKGKKRDSAGNNPEQANQRLTQVENVVRDIQGTVNKILKKLG